MRIGKPAGLKAASAKLMATRWSSWVSMLAAFQSSVRGGGVMRMKSAPSSTLAPSWRSPAAMAAMRSVSFTRQLAMLRKRLLPWAYSAITARVIAASGMWLQSISMALSGHPCPGAPRPGGFDEADVALYRIQAQTGNPDALGAVRATGARGNGAQRDEIAGR